MGAAERAVLLRQQRVHLLAGVLLGQPSDHGAGLLVEVLVESLHGLAEHASEGHQLVLLGRGRARLIMQRSKEAGDPGLFP